eukprot:TRINITY_DN1971_c0_g1_i1.p1 TRINITY_DN1971_c0_g1~~TRINITY_DN1971_c0_g1_i1.p1  ORF type:complete len:391 (-),score=64.47 TRINITY_DN1971_c0_g1_i1:58-1230(-)
MRRGGSGGGNPSSKVLIIGGIVFIATIFFLTRGGSDDSHGHGHSHVSPQDIYQEGHPGKKTLKPTANHFKVPVFSRNGQQVVARLDYQKTTINEINITTHYEENGETKFMDLLVTGTTTTPPFAAVVANPHQEAASWDLWANGDMEIPTGRMFQFLLKDRCKNGNYLVVDAGSNLGYFGTYSGVMGCRVIAFEPQPRLLPIIRTSVLVNDLTERFELHNNIINTDRTERLKIVYAAGVCTGCSSVSKASPGETNTANSFIIDAIRIDDVVKEDVLLMKVDVEGYEVLAIESAESVFKNHNILNILVEWFPDRFPHGIERGTKLLEDLCDRGYKIRHYDLRFKLPQQWVTEETWPIGGKTWLIPKDRIKDVNEFLKKDSYGEANLWISKER